MCKEKLFPKPERKEKSLSPTISDKWFHQDDLTKHFKNVFDTTTCIRDKQTSSRSHHREKCQRLGEMRRTRRMDILNKIPEGKKVWEIEYHILYCNSEFTEQ